MDEEARRRLQTIRHKFTEVGVEALSNEELLELLLHYPSPRRDNRAKAEELLDRYGTLNNLMFSSVEQLQLVGGLGENPAVFLSLISQTSRHIFLEQMEQREGAFLKTADTGQYFLELLHGQYREAFYELCLSGDSFLACYPLTDGGVLSAELEVRKEIARRAVEGALKSAADAVILCHSQPEGVASLSLADRVTAEKVTSALDTVHVTLRDYFVVTDDDFVSLLETGLLENGGRTEHGTL